MYPSQIVGIGNAYRSYPQVAAVNQTEVWKGGKQENLPTVIPPPPNIPVAFPPKPALIIAPTLYYYLESNQGYQPPVSANFGPVPFPPPPTVTYPGPAVPLLPPIYPVVNPVVVTPAIFLPLPTLMIYPAAYYYPESNQGYQPLVSPNFGPIPFPPAPFLIFQVKQFDYPEQGFQPLPSTNFGPVPFNRLLQYMAFYNQYSYPQQAPVLQVQAGVAPPPAVADVGWVPHFLTVTAMVRGS